jgi:hypothetical protein
MIGLPDFTELTTAAQNIKKMAMALTKAPKPSRASGHTPFFDPQI